MSNCQEQGRHPNGSKDHLQKQHCAKDGSLTSGLHSDPVSSGILPPDANWSRCEGGILKAHILPSHALFPSFQV